MKKSARLIVAAGESSPDMRYAAGFSTPDPFIWFGCGTRSVCAMSALEFDRAAASAAPGVEVRRDAELGGSDRIAVVRNLCNEFGVGSVSVPADFPLGFADALRGAGIGVEPVRGPFFPEREFKDAREAGAVHEALRGAEAGARRAFEVLRETDIAPDGKLLWHGRALTSEILRAEIDCTMLRRGLLPTGTICAGGIQGAQPHHPGSGALFAGTPIVMDIFPRSLSSGYWGDLTRTVVRGTPAPIVSKAFEAVFEAREFAVSLIRIGAHPAEIHRAAAAVLERHGFRTGCGERGDFGFFHGLGHGVGLEIHEAPRLSPRASSPLRGGEIVTVEPGLYYPEWGGIRLEDMVWLHPDGHCERLTEIETPWCL